MLYPLPPTLLSPSHTLSLSGPGPGAPGTATLQCCGLPTNHTTTIPTAPLTYLSEWPRAIHCWLCSTA